MRCGKHRGAAALIGLLLVIVIVMILYFINIKAIFQPKGSPSRKPTDDPRPWKLEHLILEENEIVPLPEAPKPTLENKVCVQGQVQRNDAERGRIRIHFLTDGTVTGTWQTSYEHDLNAYAFEASFSGNIVTEPDKEIAEGLDPTELFLIAKGRYRKSTYNEKTAASVGETGIVYVTGRLTPQHQAKGKLTITTDKTWSAQYDWSGAQIDCGD